MWYIMNPLSLDRAITMSSIYYTWIELIITKEGSHNFSNILCWHRNHRRALNTIIILLLHIKQKPNITINQFIHTSLVLHVKVDKASAPSGPIKKFECIQSGVGGSLILRLREYLPGGWNQLSASIWKDSYLPIPLCEQLLMLLPFCTLNIFKIVDNSVIHVV